MVKNFSLWLIFSLLIIATTATACLAGQDSVGVQKCFSSCCIQSSESKTLQIEKDQSIQSENSKVKEEQKKDLEVKESNTSILTSNFIFYIIYKFKFVDNSTESDDKDNDDQASSPLANIGNSLMNYVYSLFRP